MCHTVRAAFTEALTDLGGRLRCSHRSKIVLDRQNWAESLSVAAGGLHIMCGKTRPPPNLPFGDSGPEGSKLRPIRSRKLSTQM